MTMIQILQNSIRRNMQHAMRLIVVGALGASALHAVAQDSTADTSTDRKNAPPPAAEPSAEPPATLDDLLGIDDDNEDDNAASAAAREQEEALEDRLNEESVSDAFHEAIAKMTLSADRLDQSFDPGLGTQRIQEDIIAKLSYLIEKAQEQQQSSSSSSSSSSSQQQQQQQQ
ncbi:MAG: hypothetical protein KC983_05975, partial [Phycisphaerales bacterium]|nr:hypothetical protein [Phycisphaerales bacterium]